VPYRKHDPRRYSVQLWQSCALTSHDTVARVKYENKSRHVLKRLTSEGLIYTISLGSPMPSVQRLFQYPKRSGQSHCGANACEPQDPRSVEGVTDEVKKHLQSRKKSYPGQSDAERWKEIYHVLFPSVPNEAIPSPCE